MILNGKEILLSPDFLNDNNLWDSIWLMKAQKENIQEPLKDLENGSI